jgi:hypothetical protein
VELPLSNIFPLQIGPQRSTAPCLCENYLLDFLYLKNISLSLSLSLTHRHFTVKASLFFSHVTTVHLNCSPLSSFFKFSHFFFILHSLLYNSENGLLFYTALGYWAVCTTIISIHQMTEKIQKVFLQMITSHCGCGLFSIKNCHP